ncbi:MAG: hypothetical protein AUK63_193 [bacterium P3]|nr:MAG: hypothetical protein AUK63_193 [bacterium P3]KWW42345.1 MAG: hypothetical protein F083_249 [bacterium F083]
MTKRLHPAFIIFLLAFSGVVRAQMPGGVPVERTSQTQWVGGREFYIHVVQKGQTVYSIARAYGVKDYDAVVKKDIHFLSVGDTVWIPLQKASQPDHPASTPARQPDTPAKSTPVMPSPAVVRDRVDSDAIVVSLLMPLYLDQIDEISTTKFDVEQRGRKSYRQFEFIQFYEGIQMGLQKLQQRGVNVRLNVVDVPVNDAKTVESRWKSHSVGRSDVVITMLQKEAFDCASRLAASDHVFIVNPLSIRQEIVSANPYVVKCQPSASARIRLLLEYMQRSMPGVPLYVIHSKSAAEKPVLDELRSQLESQSAVRYTLFDWAASGKLASTLKGNSKIAVLSIYDAGKDRNRTYVNTLLGRLSSLSSKCDITLVTLDNWCELYRDVDLAFLQNQHYHTFLSHEWDHRNRLHIDFLRSFYRQYQVEPSNYYAAMGHDAILYFVTGLHTRGSDFWRNPDLIPQPDGLLRPQTLHHSLPGGGFEGNSAQLYRMVNYQFIECR